MTICAKCKYHKFTSVPDTFCMITECTSSYTIDPITGDKIYRRCEDVRKDNVLRGNCMIYEEKENLITKLFKICYEKIMFLLNKQRD